MVRLPMRWSATTNQARIIEVGSGHSTRFMLQAVADGDFSCAVTAIDPAPRAAIDALPVRLIRKPVPRG